MITKKALTQIEGKDLITDFYKSKLKPGEFCKQKNITYYTLQYWRDKYLAKNNNPSINKTNFLPINVVKSKLSSNFIKVIVNSKITIELANDVDLSRFKQILEICTLCG